MTTPKKKKNNKIMFLILATTALLIVGTASGLVDSITCLSGLYCNPNPLLGTAYIVLKNASTTEIGGIKALNCSTGEVWTGLDSTSVPICRPINSSAVANQTWTRMGTTTSLSNPADIVLIGNGVASPSVLVNSDGISFQVYNTSGAASGTSLVVDSSQQYVGINTSNPLRALHVVGSSLLTQNATFQKSMTVQDDLDFDSGSRVYWDNRDYETIYENSDSLFAVSYHDIALFLDANADGNSKFRVERNGLPGSSSEVFVVAEVNATMYGTVNVTGGLNSTVVRVYTPTAPTCSASTAGSVTFNASDSKHYGCDGTTWRAFY